MANPITWDDVLAIASELEDVPEAAQTLVLEHVNSALKESMFTPASLKLARCYLAAHLGTFALPDASASGSGDVVSETVGGISRTYSAVAGATSFAGINATTYGDLYLMLLRASKARIPRVF